MEYSVEECLMKVEGVSLSYDRPILTDINFQVNNIVRPNMNQGQVLSLVGRSGIGKTQLFKILSGLMKPDTGSVLITDKLTPVRAGDVSVVPQNYILFSHRTVRSNLELALKNSPVELVDGTHEVKFLIQEYAQVFDVVDHLDKYPSQLSGGQRQRVSIIQQLLTGNKFILLDEPFSGLDIVVKEKVITMLKKVSVMHEHTTMIITSHDIESSLSVSDSVLLLGRTPMKEGATIIETIDLAQHSLAWLEEMSYQERHAKFSEIIDHIRHVI